MAGPEFYDTLDLSACARQAAQAAKTEAHAKPCPGGMMTVVEDSGFGGLMFHEACGHSLEANSVAKGHSEFSGKLGQQVASPLVTLVDDGTLPGQWGSMAMDDEGDSAKRNVLIENGILKGYLIDRLESRRMGLPATGSGRRQNYRFPPEARMTNTFLAAGDSAREDIISATERGLFVGSINGGSVNPVTGEFNFSASQCRLIENGRLTQPVRGATLIGTGGQVLREVDMVGSNLALGQGYCYNNSGALFISAGQPTIRVKNILVGGLE
jgi:TldD protein